MKYVNYLVSFSVSDNQKETDLYLLVRDVNFKFMREFDEIKSCEVVPLPAEFSEPKEAE